MTMAVILKVATPCFLEFQNQDLQLLGNSEAINAGESLLPEVLPTHDLSRQYLPHQNSTPKTILSDFAMVALEYCNAQGCGLLFMDGFE